MAVAGCALAVAATTGVLVGLGVSAPDDVPAPATTTGVFTTGVFTTALVVGVAVAAVPGTVGPPVDPTGTPWLPVLGADGAPGPAAATVPPDEG